MTEWIALDPENLPDSSAGPFIATNNITARNARDRMSHVWLTAMFHVTSEPEGPITAFAEPSWQKIWGLTHYAVIDPPSA